MEADEIIEEFTYNTGRFARRATQAAIERREEITPHLLRVLEETIEFADTVAEESRWFAHMYALPWLPPLAPFPSAELPVNSARRQAGCDGPPGKGRRQGKKKEGRGTMKALALVRSRGAVVPAGRARSSAPTSLRVGAGAPAASSRGPRARRRNPRETPANESEAFLVLLDRAGRKTGSIPAEVIVRHVLHVTRDADWPVKREALEALLRRFAFQQRDRLAVVSRPARDRIFGRYRTSRTGLPARPYTTVLESVDPPRGSCDCPDFLRSSLGLCKHLITILEDWSSKPRKLARALRGVEAPARRPSRLWWDPVRPLTGPGDWLERVRWTGLIEAPAPSSPVPALRWFRKRPEGDLVIADTQASNPARRLQMVLHLLDASSSPRGGASPPLGPDPALRALLLEEKARLELRSRDSIEPRKLERVLDSLLRELYPYQREGVECFLASKRLLLADDMGLGKTAQAVAACHALWRTGKARRGLLIVPASLKSQWLREWRLFTDTPAAIVEGPAEDRKKTFRGAREGFLIANYEQLLRDLDVMRAWKPDIVVLDEAQRIKNWSTKTSVYVKDLRPAYRLVLTGTPMENRLEELASIMDWVDDHALEPKWRLAPCHAVQVDGRRDVGGARNLDTLRSRLKPWMVRRVRQEVLRQLPPRTDTRVPVEMTPEQQSAHDDLSMPIAQLASISARRPLTQAEFLKLMKLLVEQRIISNGMALHRFLEVWPALSRCEEPTEFMLQSLSSPKLIAIRELLSEVVAGQKRKVVVFSQWVRMLHLAHWASKDVLSRAGARGVFFTGQESPKRREQNLVDFHDDPAARVLFASESGGVGLNLQRAATCVINLELPWNPAVLEQRIGRIFRLGQKHPIDVYNLVCERGIESKICALVGTKQAFFKGLFDGTSDSVKFEDSGSFFSRLEKIIEPPRVPDRAPADVDLIEANDADTGKEPGEVASVMDDSPVLALPAPEPSSQGDSAVAGIAAPVTESGGAHTEAGEIRRLLASLDVRATPDGGITLTAPPEAAAGLAALFESMAGMLRAGAPAG